METNAGNRCGHQMMIPATHTVDLYTVTHWGNQLGHNCYLKIRYLCAIKIIHNMKWNSISHLWIGGPFAYSEKHQIEHVYPGSASTRATPAAATSVLRPRWQEGDPQGWWWLGVRISILRVLINLRLKTAASGPRGGHIARDKYHIGCPLWGRRGRVCNWRFTGGHYIYYISDGRKPDDVPPNQEILFLNKGGTTPSICNLNKSRQSPVAVPHDDVLDWHRPYPSALKDSTRLYNG